MEEFPERRENRFSAKTFLFECREAQENLCPDLLFIVGW